MSDKIHKPCYFYNTGGCYHSDGTVKTGEQCKYLHVKINEPLEKPQHLKPPCKFYHLRAHCKNLYCVFGHCELSTSRWTRFFPAHRYPGFDYTRRCIWIGERSTDIRTYTPPLSTNVKQVKATILILMLKMLDELDGEIESCTSHGP